LAELFKNVVAIFCDAVYIFLMITILSLL